MMQCTDAFVSPALWLVMIAPGDWSVVAEQVVGGLPCELPRMQLHVALDHTHLELRHVDKLGGCSPLGIKLAGHPGRAKYAWQQLEAAGYYL